MKIISFMKYSKNIIILLALSGLGACSGGAGDQISLKSDPLWEQLTQMQKDILSQKAEGSSDKYRIEQIYKPAKPAFEGADENFLKDHKKDLIFKKIDKMIRDFSRAILKFEKMPADDREFEMVQVERLFSRFITEKMKWDELMVKAEDDAIFAEKFNQAVKLYGRLPSVE